MDRIDEWRLFASVARHGSFVRAAEQYRRSPQAVTRAIAALEARVGVRLLHRTTRAVSLSDAGRRYLPRAQSALAEFERLEAPVETSAALSGSLSLTAPILFGQLHVVPVVASFLEQHPELEVQMLLVDRVVSLADEGIDFGVRLGALRDSALRARRVGEVRTLVCASPGYLRARGTPRNPAALAKHSCISFTATSAIADRWTFPGRRRVTVRPRLTVNTAAAAIAAAVSGIGIVRVYSYQVAEHLGAGDLQRVLKAHEPEPVPVQLVQLPGASSRAATLFIEHAAEALGRALAAANTRL
jgi:DNA-binding transcriptional LysR family regulator